MPEINPRFVLEGFMSTCGLGFEYPPPEFYAIHRPTAPGGVNSLITPDQPQQRWVREGDEGWNAAIAAWHRENPGIRLSVQGNSLVAQPLTRRRETIELGRYLGKRPEGMWLLNGDGFTNAALTRFQADLRQRAENDGRQTHGVRARHRSRLIIPYQALTAAQLNLDTIKAVHVTRDGTVSTQREVPRPPDAILKEHMPTGAMREIATTSALSLYQTAGTTTTTVTSGTNVMWPQTRQERDTRRMFNYQGRAYTATRWNENDAVFYEVMHQAEYAAAPLRHTIREMGDGKWIVTEQVHRLGATVFSAVGPDGKRHRWVSAFDQNENPAMYFLAMLPDKGSAKYYGHAMRLLAPPIVHRARQQGKRVFRQGDIFAVETDLTDEQLTKAGATITCRDEVFTGSLSIDGTALTNQQITVTEEGRKNWRVRRRLQIYGTSHTATWVAVKPDNSTFVKGVMFHDPVLENLRAGREPEHRLVELTPEKWFLAVRNTVPRQTPITQTDVSRGVSLQ